MKWYLIAVLGMFNVLQLEAQIKNPVKWSFAVKKLKADMNVLYFKADIIDGWHIYSVHQPEGGPLKTSITFNPSNEFNLIGEITEEKPIKKFEPVYGIDVYFFKRSVVFSQKIKLRKLRKEDFQIRGKVRFMACTDEECLSPTEVQFNVAVK